MKARRRETQRSNHHSPRTEDIRSEEGEDHPRLHRRSISSRSPPHPSHPLVLREREIHTCKIRDWNLYSTLVCIWFDLQLLWLATVISRWTSFTLLWYHYVILLSCVSRSHWRGRCRGLVRCDVPILFHLFVNLWLRWLYMSMNVYVHLMLLSNLMAQIAWSQELINRNLCASESATPEWHGRYQRGSSHTRGITRNHQA